MIIATPVVGAVVGVALAIAQPTREVVQKGAVVVHASFWHLLLVSVLGALGAIIGVAGIVVLVAIAVYRIRGDRTWSVKWALSMKTSEEGGTLRQDSVQLVCSGHPPVDVASLGYVDAVVRLPTGEWRQIPQYGMNQGKGPCGY